MVYKIYKQYELEGEIKTIVLPTKEMYAQLLKLTPILLEQKTAKQVGLLYCVILQGVSNVDIATVDRFISGMMCEEDKKIFTEMLQDLNELMTNILVIQLERLFKMDKEEVLKNLEVVLDEKN